VEAAEQPGDPIFVREAHRVTLFYVRFVRRHRLVLVGVPLAAAVLALAATLLQPRRYESTVTMMSAGTDAASAPSVATYVPYLQNHRIVDGVIRDFKLSDAPHRLTRTEFFRSAFDVEAVRNTNLLTMRLRLHDPQLAADVLNRISKDAIDLVRRTNAENATSIRDILRTQLDEARQRLEAGTKQLLLYRDASQIELLRRDIDAALAQRGQLLALSMEIEQMRSRLVRAQAELQSRTRIDTLRQSIDDSPVLMEAARTSSALEKTTDSRPLMGLELKSDVVNPVYDALDTQVATTRAELAGLERKREQLVKTEGVAEPQMRQLSRLYTVEAELARLELEQELRKEVFTEVSNRYELARLDVAKHGELFVVDPALPADRPLARGTVNNVLMATLMGVVLAFAVVVIGRRA
jgi:uncharacterized protein involved in exopolysaccharide biosynthesis